MFDSTQMGIVKIKLMWMLIVFAKITVSVAVMWLWQNFPLVSSSLELEGTRTNGPSWLR